MNFLTFKSGVQKPAEECARDRKPEWPDLIAVRMSRRQAIRHLASLARQLETLPEDETNGEDSFELVLTGKLEPTDGVKV